MQPQNVRRTLDGLKTETRRLIKGLDAISDDPSATRVELHDGAWKAWHEEYPDEGHVVLRCPYGAVGDRLWVREAFTLLALPCPTGGAEQIRRAPRCNARPGWVLGAWYDGDPYPGGWSEQIKRMSPLYMPRWASRCTVEVVAVHPERIQGITEEGARREGITDDDVIRAHVPTARDVYQLEWEDMHGRESWTRNDWVWVVSYRVVP